MTVGAVMTDFYDLPPGYDASWKDSASCRDADPDLFFPVRGGTSREARRICAACPVWEDCIEFGTWIVRAEAGVWGGASERDRRAIRAGRVEVAEIRAMLDGLL